MYNKCSDNVVTNNNNDTRVFDISRNMLNIVFSKIKQINETTSNLRGRINYVIKYRLISFPFCLEKTYGAILKNNFKIKENLNISPNISDRDISARILFNEILRNLRKY